MTEKKQALSALSGHWGIAILTTFVATLLGAFGSSGSLNIEERFSREDLARIHVPVLDMSLLHLLTILATIALVLTAIAFLFGGATELGHKKFCLRLLRGENPEFRSLFDYYDRFGKAFCLRFLISLYTILWSLLLIIPGIIAAYSYTMAPYLMAENPDLSISEAITTSKEMMKGHKLDLFFLYLSFLGWSILCLFTLGIGYLWLRPYVATAEAAFYEDLAGVSRLEEAGF